MIQMPPKHNEFIAQVVNPTNALTLNSITNSTSGSSSSSSGNSAFNTYFLVPSTITNSSSPLPPPPQQSITNFDDFLTTTSYFNHLGSTSPDSTSSSSSSGALDLIDELDVNMDDMMRHASLTNANSTAAINSLDDMILDGSSLGDFKDINVDINALPSMVAHGPIAITSNSYGSSAIKQEATYQNDDDACNTNSSSFSNGSIDKLNSTTTTASNGSNSQVTTIVTNRNGKSVVEKRFGPITVRPRRNPAPTLSSGRRSKYIELSPEEEAKREVRRQRNRQAAEKCKQKRNEIETHLEAQLKQMQEMKRLLDSEIDSLETKKRELETRFKRHIDYACCASNGQFVANAGSSTYQQHQQQILNQVNQANQVYYYAPNSNQSAAVPLIDYSVSYTAPNAAQYTGSTAISYASQAGNQPSNSTTTMTNLLFNMQPPQQQHPQQPQSHHYAQKNW